jgi:hypothetical protein
VTYDVRVCKLDSKKTHEAAIAGSEPILVLKRTAETSVEVPLAKLKVGSEYVWQVRLFTNGRQVAASSVKSFIIADKTEKEFEALGQSHGKKSKRKHSKRLTKDSCPH